MFKRFISFLLERRLPNWQIALWAFWADYIGRNEISIFSMQGLSAVLFFIGAGMILSGLLDILRRRYGL